MLKKQVGIIGMAIMGFNLSLNIEKHGYNVSIFNRSREKTDKIIFENPKKKLFPYYTIQEFVFSLQNPRFIILMVQAGKVTDYFLDLLEPFLEEKDIIMDGGNSFYKDTIRREKKLLKKNINYIGAGISGGEEGALNGPAIMPGGKKYIYEFISPILKKIAAKTSKGEACVTYIGPNGSGHYVKMIHNAIEYANMQLISEIYFLFKKIFNFNNNYIANIFTKWNQGELNSYLLKITCNILVKKDEKNDFLLDKILDIADNKGTGKWAIHEALDLNEPLTIATESIFSRYISVLKEERIQASKIFFGTKKTIKKYPKNIKVYIEKMRKALYLSIIISYTQGFSQLRNASNTKKWNLNCKKIAKIFRKGCIIQAKILKEIINSYENNIKTTNFFLEPYFKNISNTYQQSLRDVIIYAIQHGIPIPALSSAINYYDNYRTKFLPSNLIQAQRDYFGSHYYQRIDKSGNFHTKWAE
ncbi:MAG: 6-phosphogluconate dehydrogenase, decarboxylating [Candidatus Westeberhardia cardiocondylae]|nr:6-phosphogluconate dehydrogenase, decarboxylating [Candidatus Westeberhardia cardiocondylae]